MKFLRQYIFTVHIFLLGAPLFAQTFITKGKIEYEVKTDIQKTMGSSGWDAMIKEKIPRFKTGYFTLTFANDKSIYVFDRWGEPKMPDYILAGEDANKNYFDFSSGIFERQKAVSGTVLNISDSIPRLNWKLDNEYRIIAGFNCRKAQAILFDSVYVFAFYTEEILLPGGPESFQGLPGTILGVTVPRLYTSWVATKVVVNDVNTSGIKPIAARKTMSQKEIAALIRKRLSDWYTPDDPEEYKEVQEQKARFYWNTLL